MTSTLSRRAFLLAAAAAGVGTTAAWRLLAADEEAALGPMFDDPDAARSVGEAYLEQHPADANEQKLVAALGLDLGAVSAVGADRLRARVRDDYARSELVLVEGWYLSRTEARLCALSAYA